MKFFNIIDDSFATKGCPWFRSAIATKGTLISCPSCHHAEVSPSGLILLEPEVGKGSFWPDIINHGGGPQGLFVSKAVIEDWDKAGIKYGALCQTKIDGPMPKKLKGIPSPDYFFVITRQAATLDWERSGFELRGSCRTCGRLSLFRLNVMDPVYLMRDSWTGDDVFLAERSMARTYCTERVVELAKAKGHTNFRFEPIGT